VLAANRYVGRERGLKCYRVICDTTHGLRPMRR
jgi:hypothetical protein